MDREWWGRWSGWRDRLLDRWESCPPRVLQIGACALRFAAGALLGAGTILGRCSPFGIAFVGAGGAGLCNAFALMGVCVGSFLGLPFADALHYAAAAILVFAVAYAFGGTRLYKNYWFLPGVTMGITALTGGALLTGTGSPGDAACLVTEVLLSGFCCLCYRTVLRERSGGGDVRRRQISQLTLVITLLVPLVPVAPLGGPSWGRTAAALVVLLMAGRGGVGMGATAGIAMGAAVDLAAGTPGLCATALFGVSGLLCGLFAPVGRLYAALVSAAVQILLALWLGDMAAAVPILYEVLVSSAAFLLLPEPMLRRTEALIREAAAPEETEERRQLELAREKLEQRAEAFRQLHSALRLSAVLPEEKTDVARIYDRAAARVCRSCALWDSCWKRNYERTFQALSDASPALLRRGRAKKEDFPPAFTGRCLRFPEFLRAVDGELSIAAYRQICNARVRESRSAVCRQYEALAGLLGAAAEELRCEAQSEPAAERRLRRWLAERQMASSGLVFRDGGSRLRVEVRGSDAERLCRPEQIRQLASLLELPLREPVVQREDGRVRLVFRQEEPYTAVIGVAACRKDGESVSGDAGTYFKTEEGILYLILSDGMGAGEAAARESGLAIRLLESFLRAGVEPDEAMQTIRGALALRWEQEGGFATLDLLRVDLFTGDTALEKYGAAASYVRRRGHVSRVACRTLPPGLEGEPPSAVRFRLEPEDLVVLISDGVDDGEDGRWIRRTVAAWQGDSPRELAQGLLERAKEHSAYRDDRTVLTLRLTRRGKARV